MSQRIRTHRTITMLLSGLVAVLAASPAPVAGRVPLSPPATPGQQSADLAPALAANGTFLGVPGLAGTVDASAWTLVSNLSAGEAPRFALAASNVSQSPVGPWSALGNNGVGVGALGYNVYALAISGTDLYVGGGFVDAAGIPEADRIAKWDGSNWSALGNNGSSDGALTGEVYALAVLDGDLYVGGGFTDAKGILEADRIARWDGLDWFALGDNGVGVGALNGAVTALAVLGTDLYAGGVFTNAQGTPEADHIAKWDGVAWSPLGSNGAGDGALNSGVNALAVSGNDLYVGGSFTDARGNAEADFVAMYDGNDWFALGSNGSSDGALGDWVNALAVSGGDLYVGGSFQNAAGHAKADYIAKWNGIVWSALGSNPAGTNGALKFKVYALAFSGSDLYVGGGFANAAGISAADNIAKWNGSAWSALGSNGSGDGALNSVGEVYALALSGTDLYVGGAFQNAAGIPEADHVAKWALGSPRKPDGRIRKGSGAFVGNNIYNTTGVNQTKTGSAAIGSTITFGISIQNDGSSADSFKVLASGSATTMYTVRYFHGTTEITAAVLAGTYQTPSLAPGTTFLITAKVKVKSSATAGSSVTRLVTTTSVGDSTKQDAVKFVGGRA